MTSGSVLQLQLQERRARHGRVGYSILVFFVFFLSLSTPRLTIVVVCAISPFLPSRSFATCNHPRLLPFPRTHANQPPSFRTSNIHSIRELSLSIVVHYCCVSDIADGDVHVWVSFVHFSLLEWKGKG